MAHYVSQGSIPSKRHIVHKIDGKHTFEELVSRRGFADVCSNMYHRNMPTDVNKLGKTESLEIKSSSDASHRNRHIKTVNLDAGGDSLYGRKILAYNSDCIITTCEPTEEAGYFYRNGQADELIFVHFGSGTLETSLGNLDFHEGDYIIIPRGIIHKFRYNSGRVKLLQIESAGAIETPAHFRNQHGQLLEHAPYCERDFRIPVLQPARDSQGSFEVKIKMGNKIQTVFYTNHPFDVVGWDGFYYPWIFNINDFMPIVGKVHLPPPVHLTFTTPGFVICSFVPRLYDFHDEAVPIPYAHSNVDSDEVLYYVMGNFMSRRGIDVESMTFHPMGYPHGPQPGLLEPSLGKKETVELAVMIDTFKPLIMASAADAIDDRNYHLSWQEKA
jgi:homogentisate 1,2-dioxygenase